MLIQHASNFMARQEGNEARDGSTYEQAGTTPSIDQRPHVTLCPQTPWLAAGWRMLPVATSTISVSTSGIS